MKTIISLFLIVSFAFSVSCEEKIYYFNQGSPGLQYQEINLTCIDGYRFRVLSEEQTKKILEIEDNKYLNKGKINENKKN